MRFDLLKLALTGVVVAALGVVGCGEEDQAGPAMPSHEGAEVSHIHGLGTNPSDGSLFVATHSGLFQAAADSTALTHVGSTQQDVMGFTVVGPDHFVASGHPAPGETGPPHFGLIESRDAGESWQEVSLSGRADFHVLRSSAGRIYGYNGLTGKLMISSDSGKTWKSSTPPAPLFDVAIDPGDPEHLVASSEAGLLERQGNRWRRLSKELGFLAWPQEDALYLAGLDGSVSVSGNSGGKWTRRGQVSETPVAFSVSDAKTLQLATEAGTVQQSGDGGRSWTLRARGGS